MKRRNFLKVGAAVGAASVFNFNSLHSAVTTQNTGSLIAVMGDNPSELLRRAIREMGGIEKFVKSGDRVVLKPNIGWAKTEEMGANTNPKIVGALTRLCVEAGAKEVVVLDHTCNEWRSCYQMSGIQKEVEANGGKMAPANIESYYENVLLPQGKILKNTKIHKELINCDVWFNIPVLKHHFGTKMSISMKNYMGINWERRSFHRDGLHQCIADINTWEKKPALHIVDAFRTLTQNGPQGKGVEDVLLTNALFASQDPVAVDTAAVKFFNQIKSMKLDDISYLKLGEELNLGSRNLETKTIKRVKL